jgi:hypothetical protein
MGSLSMARAFLAVEIKLLAELMNLNEIWHEHVGET